MADPSGLASSSGAAKVSVMLLYCVLRCGVIVSASFIEVEKDTFVFLVPKAQLYGYVLHEDYLLCFIPSLLTHGSVKY
jgi:hypothetical protein